MIKDNISELKLQQPSHATTTTTTRPPAVNNSLENDMALLNVNNCRSPSRNKFKDMFTEFKRAFIKHESDGGLCSSAATQVETKQEFNSLEEDSVPFAQKVFKWLQDVEEAHGVYAYEVAGQGLQHKAVGLYPGVVDGGPVFMSTMPHSTTEDLQEEQKCNYTLMILQIYRREKEIPFTKNPYYGQQIQPKKQLARKPVPGARHVPEVASDLPKPPKNPKLHRITKKSPPYGYQSMESPRPRPTPALLHSSSGHYYLPHAPRPPFPSPNDYTYYYQFQQPFPQPYSQQQQQLDQYGQPRHHFRSSGYTRPNYYLNRE